VEVGIGAPPNRGFEGAAGRVAGAAMARLNRDMEHAAIGVLSPDHADSVLSIGFGPGVGLTELLARLPHGWAAGIDPSPAMVAQARRRNRGEVEAGRLAIAEAAAERIPWPDDSFDGVLAVNSIQLWAPLPEGLREVARVLRPGGAFVTLTHVWAIEKIRPVTDWVEATRALLETVGLGPVSARTDRYRSGAGLLLRTKLLRPCNRKAPKPPGWAG
jgi:ubiquinone/menaquinone biosynthesis C-methylase UbiE